MGKKLNKALLSEELKRFRNISEYTFYTGDDKNLILGNDLDEADDKSTENDLEPVEAPENDANVEADAVSDELGVDYTDNATDDLNADSGEDLNAAPETDMGNDMGAGDDLNATPAAAEPEMGGGDEVEVDVTDLVQGNEEVKQASNQSSLKMDELINKFGELESKLSNMDKISSKIEKLENEIEKRVPTPQEKLEMRSLDSYPYSLKLTDYWAEKEGPYNVMDNGEPKKQEYTLTPDEIDSTYSESGIKNSFDAPLDFEEEDI